MKYYEILASFDQYKKEKSALIFLTTEILQISKSELYANLNNEIDNLSYHKLQQAINEYVANNVPVQYIIGYTYFYGLKICVNKNVLIPRYETEELVDKVIELAKKYDNPRILDIGTGSGCIAIALKKNLENAIVTAVDISSEALKIAIENALLNNVEISFLESDLFANVFEQFDLIVSNPPYIDPDEEVMDLVYDNEPHLALFSPEKGLYHYRRIIEDGRKYLKEEGKIIFEIAYNKKLEMIKLAEKNFKEIEVIKDIHNNDRIMIIG